MITVQLQSRLKDLEFDNFRLERKLQETLSRQWRIESQFNNYVFQEVVRDKYETSTFYQDNGPKAVSDAKVHIVDYLSMSGFKRIQDAIDQANHYDKIVVMQGVYNEAIYIDKQITIVSNGFVELHSSSDNVITCATQGDGCLVKGLTIRRLDASKGDPLSAGAQVDQRDDDNQKHDK
jgi:pectin methylesterase-like acyl-CoA thioesterase